MSAFIDPASIDLVWTLTATGGLMGMAALALFALPWTDKEIAKIDSAFRAMGEVSAERLPVQNLG
jgi:hypothetical protein